MMKTRLSEVLVVAGLGLLLPMLATAGERKAAEAACTPVGQALVYDCLITLTGKKSGTPIAGAEFMVGADMPSMPGAHNVRPVPAEPHGRPGTYRARIELEMTGEWALRLDFTRPSRDRVVKKLHFGGMSEVEGHGAGKHDSGMSHGDEDEGMGHGSHGEQEIE